MPILFLDTESDPVTKEPQTIQAHYNGKDYVWSAGEDLIEFQRMFVNCEAVCAYNAPYDLGVLASMPEIGAFEWDGKFWRMEICGLKFRVRRISGFRNIIKSRKPVIDLLKLWSILVDDDDTITLKALIRRELGRDAIAYSPEAAKTRDYQVQDVACLCELWEVFLRKTREIRDLEGYTYKDYAAVCTPATLCKKAMRRAYPTLKDYQKHNDEQDKQHGLSRALEHAYHGGITLALHRGMVQNTAWIDIHGAYAHAIEFENTDRYILYDWSPAPNRVTISRPRLHYCMSDAHLKSINKSLKIYRTREMCGAWMWGYDIAALRRIFPDMRVSIRKSWDIIPRRNDIAESKAAYWSACKEKEQAEHGKTTLCRYYKFMSNTSYGITAQREPYRTVHTNLAIAGIITSRARLVLATMIHTAREFGGRWIYSDTDSICVELRGANPQMLADEINRRIAPYSVECEHVGDTHILSLKRYQALHDANAPDKIRLHGKSSYRISTDDMRAMLEHPADIKNTPMILGSVTAATERTHNRVRKLDSRITHPHPFMFVVRVPCDVGRAEWFAKWYAHIDTKATYPENALAGDEYERHILVFENNDAAELYFGAHATDEAMNEGWICDDDIRDAMYFGD